MNGAAVGAGDRVVRRFEDEATPAVQIQGEVPGEVIYQWMRPAGHERADVRP